MWRAAAFLVSDFAESFPLVRKAVDVVAVAKDAELTRDAALDALRVKCEQCAELADAVTVLEKSRDELKREVAQWIEAFDALGADKSGAICERDEARENLTTAYQAGYEEGKASMHARVKRLEAVVEALRCYSTVETPRQVFDALAALDAPEPSK